MNRLKTGEFYGLTNQTINLKGLILTDTEYTLPYVDWHYHENPYLTFIVQGMMLEGSLKGTHYCSTGSLLFHNWDEKHFNTKPPGFTRGFHIELTQDWLDSYDIDIKTLHGNIQVNDPAIRMLMYELFVEKNDKTNRELAVDSLLANILSQIKTVQQPGSSFQPPWVKTVREFLHDLNGQPVDLRDLAKIADVHPVHLSRDFKKYFGSNPGVYTRRLRLLHSLSLLPEQSRSLTDIALESGFADQSHFIREFRSFFQMTPKQYRKVAG